MKKKIILVVDYGTSNVRVNAVDADNGDIMHSASKKYRIEEKKDGYAEISAEHLWTYSESCMREVAENMGSDEEARAIAFSFFGDNLIPVDREGNALNDCILCTDSRGAEEAEFVNSQIPADEQISVIGDTYMVYKFGAKVLWIKRHMPEIAEKTAFYDSQQQFIFRQLGLRAANDYTMAARKQLCDIQTIRWSDRFMKVFGITEESLGADIIPTGEIVGYVENYGAVKFQKALPVIAGGHDCDLAMIGMGLSHEEQDFIGDITGTFDHVGYLARGAVNLRKERPDTSLCSYSGPLENTSVCLGAFPTAGATLEWYMREINEGTDAADYQKYWSQICFDGQGSTMVYPTLDNNRGRIEGIGVTTTKQDIFKAVIEALTFENRRLIEDCETCKAQEARSVRIGGGAANSDEWLQLRADISGKTIERMKNIQISSLGGAVLAAVRVGIYTDLEEAVRHMVHVKDRFIPNPEVRRKYESKYQIFLRKMGYRR